MNENEGVQLLMMRVDGKPFAIEVDRVMEVLEAVQPEEILDQPAEIAGLINIRGDIVAVSSLRAAAARHNSPGETVSRAVDPADRIIVVRDGDSKLGILVDHVETVQLYQEEQLFAQSLSPLAFRLVKVTNRTVELVELRDYITGYRL
ncbi:MAG: chemotaxis protein CheW [Candidatus Melainabacteria bacterium]|nr:chemotaxis protein CheW [Candidatus Melainabacteria bacterium]